MGSTKVALQFSATEYSLPRVRYGTISIPFVQPTRNLRFLESYAWRTSSPSAADASSQA